jgi:hypothetical protein
MAQRTFRAAYWVCYVVTLASGTAAARLADDFRVLGSAGRGLRPLGFVLQVPVLACWTIVRPISLVAFAGCVGLAPRAARR